MPVSASTLAKLIEAGFSGGALVDIVASIDSDNSANHTPSRSSESAGAKRMKNYRQRRVDLGMSPYFDGAAFKQKLINRDGNACIYCETGSPSCIDHMIPIIAGGTDDLDNLGLACNACNGKKSGQTPLEAGMAISILSAQEAHVRYQRAPRTLVSPHARVEGSSNNLETTGKKTSSLRSDSARAKTKTRILETWEPSEKNRKDAIRWEVAEADIDREAEKFRDHHLKLGSLFLDWNAAWRTWCRNVNEFASRGRAPKPNGTGPPHKPKTMSAKLTALTDQPLEQTYGRSRTESHPETTVRAIRDR